MKIKLFTLMKVKAFLKPSVCTDNGPLYYSKTNLKCFCNRNVFGVHRKQCTSALMRQGCQSQWWVTCLRFTINTQDFQNNLFCFLCVKQSVV